MLWPDLETAPDDHMFDKCRYSEFARGASDVEAQLTARGIDTVIVVGTIWAIFDFGMSQDFPTGRLWGR